MRFELPVCARCCFCLPLRYGLIFWGYLQLLFSGFLITMFSFWINYVVTDYYRNIKNPLTVNGAPVALWELILGPCIIISIIVTDFVLNIVFIVGCHKKNVRLIKCYYFYTIILLVLFTGLSIYVTGTSIYYTYKYSSFLGSRGMSELIDAITLFAYIGFEVYIILLIRSELIKLDNGCQFRFVNNATEAECTLSMDTECMGRTTLLYGRTSDTRDAEGHLQIVE